MFTCSKLYSDLPFSHRQHNHRGHCQLIHGHNWAFKFTFAAHARDENGFVFDFGGLKALKEWLAENFDHTLVLNADDPKLAWFKRTLRDKLIEAGENPVAKIIVVPNASSEGLAEFLFEMVDNLIRSGTITPAFPEGRCWLQEVEVIEDSRNSAKLVKKEACGHV